MRAHQASGIEVIASVCSGHISPRSLIPTERAGGSDEREQARVEASQGGAEMGGGAAGATRRPDRGVSRAGGEFSPCFTLWVKIQSVFCQV